MKRTAIGTAALGALGALALLLFNFVLPIDEYRNQRARIETYERIVRDQAVELERLEREVAAARSPVAVERAAREQQALARPGDKQYVLSVEVSDTNMLPVNWPLPGFRHLVYP